MLQPISAKDNLGKRYQLRTSSTVSSSRKLNIKQFTDLNSAMRFISRLQVSSSHLKKLIHAAGDGKYIDYHRDADRLFKQVAHLLLRGRIKVIEVTQIDQEKYPSSKRTVRKTGGEVVKFTPASLVQDTEQKKAVQFKNKQDAEIFVKALQADSNTFAEIEKSLKLKVAPAKNPFAAADSTSNLAQALVDGDVVAVVDKVQGPKAPKTEVEDDNSNTPGVKAVDSLPESTAQQNVTSADEEKPICKLTKMSAKCSHNSRTVVNSTSSKKEKLLAVIASPTAQRGFEKIEVNVETDAPCGNHNSNSSHMQPEPQKTIKEGLKTTYSLASEPISNPLKFLWLPSIKPKTYKISPSACEKESSCLVKVDVYPKVSWNVNVAYSCGGAESSVKDKDGKQVTEHKNNAPKFTGKVELNYDEKKEDLTLEYKNGIDEVLTKLDWVREKVDLFLQKISGGSSITLAVSWPNFSVKYDTSLNEDSHASKIKTSHSLNIAADPLIGLKGSIDLFPPFLAAVEKAPQAAPIAAVLRAALDGVGSEDSIGSLQAEIALVFTVESKVVIDFSASGSNGNDDTNVKSEQKIDMAFQFEGVVGAKGHLWVVKFEKKYKAGIKTGFVGKIVITRDDIGYYWFSRFLFNGIVVYFTKYEKLEKEVTSTPRGSDAFFGRIPDAAENSSTTEWVWVKPDADEEAPEETQVIGKDRKSHRHYLVRFD